MKKRKSTPAYKNLALRIVLPALAAWLLAMVLLTLAVARDFYRQLDESAFDWLISASKLAPEDSETGAVEQAMLEQLYFGNMLLGADPLLPIVLPQNDGSVSSDDLAWDNWELFLGFQAAIGYYDSQGEEIIASRDWLWFPYSNSAEPEGGFAYVDLSALPNGEQIADRFIRTGPLSGGIILLLNDTYVSMTGYFEGEQFFPVRLHIKGEMIETGLETDRALETIYTYNLQGFSYTPGNPFLYGWKWYQTPAQLLDQGLGSRYGLFSAVIMCRTATDVGGKVELAVWCSPVLYALCRLWPVYLVTGALLVMCLRRILKGIRAELTEPLAVINRAFAADRTELSGFAWSPMEELQTLRTHFNRVQQDRHQAHNEIRQLQTALSYAQNAEESRRKMVSAIAHELKTPLAVIHSYAEGLQDGIAAGKQDKYLAVILEETQQMDGMVQEMLELSRLEAGKVRLSIDQFSLVELTRSVFDRLAMAAEAKRLALEFQLPQELTVSTDEARIGQVITNLATNAIKYTPDGGTVCVRLCRRGAHVHFAIENDSPPLSQEALERVWDSFYRADTARDRSGTGLGLAITRSIVELHRGSCSVRNTKTGVEFGFKIPV